MLMDADFNVSTAVVDAEQVAPETCFRIQQFLYREAALLDDRSWQEWLALWTDDGMYWVPEAHDQASPYDHVSIYWENAVMRSVRVRTLEHGRGWAQQPVTRCTRVLGNVVVNGLREDGCTIVRSKFHVMQWRDRRDERLHLAGSYTHVLAPQDDGGWKIRLKRVDLVDSEGIHGPIQLYM